MRPPGAARNRGVCGRWTRVLEGVELNSYKPLKDAGGVAPARWKLAGTDWWLEEHGLIMEQPTFPLPPGKYVVTGARDATAVLTIHPADRNGDRRWELDKGATLYDVTHLALPLRTLYAGGGWWFVLAGKRAEDCVSSCARGSDASSRGLHEAGLCCSNRDRRGRGRLNAGGAPRAYAASLAAAAFDAATSTPAARRVFTCRE